MFGSVEVYFMQALGGIQPHPAAKGFDKVLIKPRPPTDLPSFGATYHSIRGTISVHWKWLTEPSSAAATSARKIDMTVTIPPNVVADIHVPSAAGTAVAEAAVGEGGTPRTHAAEGRTTVLTRGSGAHRLVSTVAWG